MCAKTATFFLVEFLSILKELCIEMARLQCTSVLTVIYKRTSICDFLFASLDGKILQKRFINAKKIAPKGANSFHCREANSFIWKLTPFVREAEIEMAGLISL